MSDVVHLSDEQLQSAIADLESSTVRINAQTMVLEKQWKLLSKSQARWQDEDRKATAAQAVCDRLIATEAQNLTFQIEEEAGSLDKDLKQQGEKATSELHGARADATVMLRHHDKRFEKLEKAIKALNDSRNSDLVALQTNISKLCEKLVQFASQELRFRLNRIYFETMENLPKFDTKLGITPDNINSKPAAEGEEVQIRSDLNSLYSEIDSVAQMSIQQSYGGPLLQAIKVHNTKEEGRRRQLLESTASQIQQMTAELSQHADQLRHLQSLRVTLATLHETQKELGERSVLRHELKKKLSVDCAITAQPGPATLSLLSSFGVYRTTAKPLDHDGIAVQLVAKDLSLRNAIDAHDKAFFIALETSIAEGRAASEVAKCMLPSMAQRQSTGTDANADLKSDTFHSFLKPEKDLADLSMKIEDVRSLIEELDARKEEMRQTEKRARARFLKTWRQD